MKGRSAGVLAGGLARASRLAVRWAWAARRGPHSPARTPALLVHSQRSALNAYALGCLECPNPGVDKRPLSPPILGHDLQIACQAIPGAEGRSDGSAPMLDWIGERLDRVTRGRLAWLLQQQGKSRQAAPANQRLLII
jgi:hypothetical protein